VTRFAPLAALVLVACSGSPAPSPAPREREAQAPTIVSLNPCTDAILADVADPAQILALSHYSRDPRGTSMDLARARRFPVTGGTVEEVLALEPDIVVASDFLPPATRAALTDLGLRVETVGIASSIAGSEAQVRRIAALAGHPERGEALVARIEEAVAANTRRGEPVPAVLWQPGGIVPGQGTLVSAMMARAGFTNFSAAHGARQADYLPLETLLANPPRVLLVAGQERMQQHRALDALPGMRRESFAPNLLYCGGPTIVAAMTRLRALRDRLSLRSGSPHRERDGIRRER